MEELLKINDLHVEYRSERARVYALNGVNLTIHKGESLGLVGESGAGKTTTALSILNLLPRGIGRYTQGEIFYDGSLISEMTERQLMEIRGGKISMIFQNPLTSLNPLFTVGEQIAMVLRKHMNMDNGQALKRACELLEIVGIPGFRYRDYPNQFSGGMRQRVGIAAGLACNPELLIADEPTTALDVTIQAQILELMKDLQNEYRTSLLMITHNLGIISELCERVAVMYAGQIIEYGTARTLFKRPMHPYTVGLLNAIPNIHEKKERLFTIPGLVANPQQLPSGCTFHPRCLECLEKCKEESPRLTPIDADHSVACHKYQAPEVNA
jgi:peptide/nickel transport system ATP-binding protein